LYSGHNGAAERARHLSRLRRCSKSALDHEGMNRLALWERCHHSETEEAPIPNDQRPRNRCIKGDFNVPEALLRKTCSKRKRFHTLTLGLERLALDAD
jgi:hypothetical protein